ncbi:NADH-quinone oxidoreductase subunit L [Buchnera aphidicola]|uniref:NADH-quinone oxidoreductase subunit L n=1 Tax=Buchnera aphidicola (Cinara strobi) TaxID=1921549 RepID=A0A3B1E9E1_9GAMM|nr:NADH-quinone oxidoreductase subunit L [Buchnera aphidicola]VAX76389.1 NADH-quinone oxidoreductase subunit L [Buchnera aphidicola (Cinara strobi)]
MNLIYFVIFSPLISFFLLIFFQKFISNRQVAIISIISMFISLLSFIYVAYDYYYLCYKSITFHIPFFHWMTIKNYSIKFNFLVDVYSLSMLGMVLLISLCIYFFSFWYMNNSLECSKYFMYTNLFIFFMMLFILTENLVSMFFTWEIVGIFSYLLIGFYFKKEENGYAAIKSFLMTRIGDVFFLISIFLIFFKFRTLDFFVLNHLRGEIIYLNSCSYYIFFIAFFLILAAVGKSAQVPFHTWLTSAMCGPTPASALIHAATLVTMGVYLIIRLYALFLYNLYIMRLLSSIGCITIIISSISAIFEKDIKRILAFSTISQIGYMFLALGTNNVLGAFYHLIFHSFFKSLLFLSAGSIIKHMNGERNILKMGGLYRKMPFIYVVFLIGCSSLASFPFLSSSCYSKGEILLNLLAKKENIFFLCSLLGVFLTSIYSFRMIFLVFHGYNKSIILSIQKNFFYYLSMIFLCLGCTPCTWYILSKIFLNMIYIPEIIRIQYWYIEYISFGVTLVGLMCVYIFYIKQPIFFKGHCLKIIFFPLTSLVFNDWFFDIFYSYFFVRSYLNIIKYFNSKNYFNIEKYFLNFINFSKKEIFKIELINIVYHIKWYIYCLEIVLILMFLEKILVSRWRFL